VRESAAARATPVQQREPERTALRPTHPREYPPSTRRAPAAWFAWSAWAAREYLWSTSKAAVRGSSAFRPRQFMTAVIAIQSHGQQLSAVRARSNVLYGAGRDYDTYEIAQAVATSHSS
jgi:hypothetical protein